MSISDLFAPPAPNFSTVWKYELADNPGPQKVTWPLWSKIKKVNTKGNKIVLWAEVDPAQAPMTRVFAIFRTGDTVDGNYVDTVLMPDSSSRHLYSID